MSVVVLAVLVLTGVAALLAIGRSDHPIERATTTPVASDQQLISAFRAGNGMPFISVQPVNVPGASPIVPSALRTKLLDALSRFDGFNITSQVVASANQSIVIAERLPARRYQLGGTVENHDGGGTTLSFWLSDVSASTVVWSRTFDGMLASAAPGATEDSIVRDVAVALAEPFGIINAYERGRSDIDPRHACLLRAYDYLRGLDATLHSDVRTCLERMTKLDPTFANGFSTLSMVYHREYSTGIGVMPGGPPALDRALKMARQAVALKPQSARAHVALLLNYFARDAFADALAEGDAALQLNPFDPTVTALYGAILVGTGQLDRGEAFLKRASAGNTLNPTALTAYLSLVSYLKGDLTTASRYANLDISDTNPLGIIVRVLVAAQTGERDRVHRLTEQFATIYPALRDDPRPALEKFIRSQQILDRLTRDLAAAGLGVKNPSVRQQGPNEADNKE